LSITNDPVKHPSPSTKPEIHYGLVLRNSIKDSKVSNLVSLIRLSEFNYFLIRNDSTLEFEYYSRFKLNYF